jgi:uncharacterized membrane protein required for colicin V production
MNATLLSLVGSSLPCLLAAAPPAPAPDTSINVFFESFGAGWFDIVVVAILIFGLVQGRRHGMSGECLPTLQWAALVLVGALLCDPLGRWLYFTLNVDLIFGLILAYLVTAVAVIFAFSMIKRSVGEKLVGADLFGRLEYYLGMLFGMFRCACVIVFLLALLNARLYSDADLAASARFQKDFEGIRFPTIGSIQQDVFKKSFSGKNLKMYAPFLLIRATAPGGNSQETIGKRREKEVNDVIGK